MLKFILYCCVWCFSITAYAQPQQVVMFGDSLSDSGNLYEYMDHQMPVSPPYYEGRFSNGPVWIEYLVEHYFPADAKQALLNYAFGGAGVSETDDPEQGGMLSFQKQVDSYLATHEDRADEHSLFVIWMGANNYIAFPEDPDHELEIVNNGIDQQLVRLVEHGAKQVMVLTVPDFGKTPGAVEFEAVDFLSDLANRHNELLRTHVLSLEQRYPEVQWILFDVNAMFLNAMNHPEEYGFTNTTGTCDELFANMNTRSSSRPQSLVFQLGTSSRWSSKVSLSHRPDCSKYLFFDIIHPTTMAHEYIAKEAIQLLDQKHIFE